MSDACFDTPRLSTIRSYCRIVSFFGGRKVHEEIAMIPGTHVTERGSLWDDHFTDSLSGRKLAHAGPVLEASIHIL